MFSSFWVLLCTSARSTPSTILGQGAAVAIDGAVPRREDTGPLAPAGDVSYPGLAAAMNIIDLVGLPILPHAPEQVCGHICTEMRLLSCEVLWMHSCSTGDPQPGGSSTAACPAGGSWRCGPPAAPAQWRGSNGAVPPLWPWA